ncbi:MAG: ATPase, T2SS/T4P/T4SS family [Singulisphaera sp.]
MPWTLDGILKGAQWRSDVHLIRGISPAFRVNGDIRLIEGDALEEEFLREMIDGLLNERHREIFARDWQLCFSRHWPDVGRFPRQRLLACRGPRDGDPPLRGNHPPPPSSACPHRRRAGAAAERPDPGDGLDRQREDDHAQLHRRPHQSPTPGQDRDHRGPVEYVHHNQSSIIVQQEVLTDTPSFRQALTHVLRQDPDVIIIGEMRDLETVSTALTAAETGHLVLATLHTPDVVQTIQRIFSVFPHEQQNNIMYQLANTLQAILAQRLLPRTDGTGQILAYEVCIATTAVRKHIRGGEPHLIFSEMQMGRKHQMQTIDGVLLDFYQRGEITYDVAMSNAREPETIRQRSAANAR